MEPKRTYKPCQTCHRKRYHGESYSCLICLGICRLCKKPTSDGKSKCGPCMKLAAQKTVARARKNRAAGLCSNCKEQATVGVFCEDHWFISRGPLGGRRSKTKTFKTKCGTRAWGDYLRELWHKQDGKSSLSGAQLFIGSNASLDRIDPNGDYTEGNVRWVTSLENASRQNMTDEEMFSLYELILRYNGRI